MLTFLSRTFRRLLDTAAGVAPTPAPVDRAQWPIPVAACASPPAPGLRLVRSSEAASGGSDNSIRVAEQPGASAFVAGSGARLYSLDAFRTRGTRPTRPRHPRAA